MWKSLDWFVGENLHRIPVVFTMIFLGGSGYFFPLNQSNEKEARLKIVYEIPKIVYEIPTPFWNSMKFFKMFYSWRVGRLLTWLTMISVKWWRISMDDILLELWEDHHAWTVSSFQSVVVALMENGRLNPSTQGLSWWQTHINNRRARWAMEINGVQPIWSMTQSLEYGGN